MQYSIQTVLSRLKIFGYLDSVENQKIIFLFIEKFCVKIEKLENIPSKTLNWLGEEDPNKYTKIFTKKVKICKIAYFCQSMQNCIVFVKICKIAYFC